MMKKSILVLFSLMMAVFASAQKKEAQVAAAAEQLRLAMIDPTAEKLEALLMDSLTYGHSGGHIDRKAEFIQKLVSGNSDFVTMNITNQSIIIEGKTAFVRHELTAETNDKGKPGNVHLLVLLVWIKQHGHWKLAARQAVKPS